MCHVAQTLLMGWPTSTLSNKDFPRPNPSGGVQWKYTNSSMGLTMRVAQVGTYEHWRIVNATEELHPMHIHQVHFLAFAENQRPIVDPVWLDTVNVPVHGSVDVIMDFNDPVIRGMSLFHCHLLNHEDKGMMAKILFE